MKYFYQMEDNFFDNPKIIDIEGYPQGDSIILILLKLYGYSVASEGHIMLKDITGEYNISSLAMILAKRCRTDAQTMQLALKVLESYEFIEIEYCPEKYIIHCKLPYVEKNTKALTEKNKYKLEQKNNVKALTDGKEDNVVKLGVFKNLALDANLLFSARTEFKNIKQVINLASIMKQDSVEQKPDLDFFYESLQKHGKRIN